MLKKDDLSFLAVFQASPLPMWVYDLETLRFVAVNVAAVEHYGYSEAEFLAMTIKDIRPTQELPKLEAVVYTKTGESVTRSGPWRHRRRDGSVIDVEIASQAIPFGGRPCRFVFAHDVTDRLRALAELAELNRVLEARVAERTHELELAAITDQLTGLHNRRKLDEAMAQEVTRSRRYGTPLAVVLGDVDKFKAVNDAFGHQVGDQVLVAFAAILRQGVREADAVGRWGGEEFMVICPHTDMAGASALAESLRQRVAQHVFPGVGQKTCSFGVAQLTEQETALTLVARADAALYRAKHAGRDRVEVG
jgi:diguanylate cyclase (GGDEF)-like protein/PAS domain S-box-containing protein